MGVSRALGYVCIILIDLISYAMFFRAIMSWFVRDDNKIYGFLVMLTEPIVAPIRRLLSRSSVGQGLPIDLSFIITYILLGLLSAILSTYFL